MKVDGSRHHFPSDGSTIANARTMTLPLKDQLRRGLMRLGAAIRAGEDVTAWAAHLAELARLVDHDKSVTVPTARPGQVSAGFLTLGPVSGDRNKPN